MLRPPTHFYGKGHYVISHPLSDLASLPIFEEAALQADLYSLLKLRT